MRLQAPVDWPGVAGETDIPDVKSVASMLARTMVSSTPKRARARARMGMVGPSARRALLRTSPRKTLHGAGLGGFATVNSDIAVAVRRESGDWKAVSERGELCRKIVDGDPTPCWWTSPALKVNIDLAKKGIKESGQEIFVKFVQNLGSRVQPARVRNGQVWERSDGLRGSLPG